MDRLSVPARGLLATIAVVICSSHYDITSKNSSAEHNCIIDIPRISLDLTMAFS